MIGLKDKNTRVKAYLACLTQVVLVGFSLIFVKIALKDLSPLEVLSQRFILAGALVVSLSIFRKSWASWDLEKIRDLYYLALLYPLGFFGFQTYAMTQSTATEAGILMALAPLATLVLAWIFLGERINKKQIFMMVLASLGLVFLALVNQKDAQFHLRGTFFLVLSLLALAGYTILVRKKTQDYSYLDITDLVLLEGAIFFLVLVVFKEGAGTLVQSFYSWKDPKIALSMAYLGIFSSYLTALLNNYALSHLKASNVAALSNLSPLITSLAASLFLGEVLSLGHILAMGLTLLGVFGLNFFKNKAEN